MNPIIGSIISPFLFLPGIILKFLPFKNSIDKKQKIQLTILYIAALLIHGGVYYFVGMATGGKLNISFLKADMIVFALFTTVINMFVIKKRIKEHFFTYGLTMLFNYMNLTMTLFLSNVTIKLTGGQNPFVFYIVYYSLLQIGIFPLSLKLLNITVTRFLTIESGNYWNTICFVPMLIFLACYFTVWGEETIDTLPPFIGRLFLFAAAFFICFAVSKSYFRMSEQIETKKQLDMQKVYYDELSDHVANARRTRHDMKHHMAAIQAYIDSDDKAGLQKYCYDFNMEYSSEFIPYTGNSAADGVLYHYSKIAKEKGIHFELKGLVKTKGILDIDLCVLIGNAIDNAIFACENVQGEKYIFVMSESNDFNITVVVRNSYDGFVEEKNGTIMSRKAPGRKGVGISSMRSVCEKYGGTLETEYDDNEFRLIFIVPFSKI